MLQEHPRQQLNHDTNVGSEHVTALCTVRTAVGSEPAGALSTQRAAVGRSHTQLILVNQHTAVISERTPPRICVRRRADGGGGADWACAVRGLVLLGLRNVRLLPIASHASSTSHP